MAIKFNFPKSKTEAETEPKLSTPISLETSINKYNFKEISPPPKLPPERRVPQVKFKTSPSEAQKEAIANTEVQMENYTWKEQVVIAPEEANVELQRRIAKLAEAIQFKNADIGQAIRRCTLFLDSHAFLKDNLTPKDVGLMLRGLSVSAGQVYKKKVTNKKKKTATSELAEGFANSLSDIDFGI